MRNVAALKILVSCIFSLAVALVFAPAESADVSPADRVQSSGQIARASGRTWSPRGKRRVVGELRRHDSPGQGCCTSRFQREVWDKCGVGKWQGCGVGDQDKG